MVDCWPAAVGRPVKMSSGAVVSCIVRAWLSLTGAGLAGGYLTVAGKGKRPAAGALGRVAVVMLSCDPTTSVRVFVIEACVASVTVTLKGNDPLAVGVPEMTPALLNERPGGKGPEPDRLHVSGATPPVACKV